jgi:hypothetical protein
MRNWRNHIGSEPGAFDAGVCEARTTEWIRIVRNDMRNTVSKRYIAKNARFIDIANGSVAADGTPRYVADLVIVNNAMASTNPVSGSQVCTEVHMGYDARSCGADKRGGTFVYRQNTCAFKGVEGRAYPALNLIPGNCGGFAGCYIENNLTSYPFGGGLLALGAKSCTTLSLRGNVWPTKTATTPFRLKGSGYGMRSFFEGPGARDRTADPKWKDGAGTAVPPSGDVHLYQGDTAAINKGVALASMCIGGDKAGSACTTDGDCGRGYCLTEGARDIDQNGAEPGTRPANGGWDAGCDEVTSGTPASAAKPPQRK